MFNYFYEWSYLSGSLQFEIKKERVIKKWEREWLVAECLLVGKERRCLNGSIESFFALNNEKEKNLKNKIFLEDNMCK